MNRRVATSLAVIFGVLACASSLAAAERPTAVGVKPDRFGVSRPVRDLPPSVPDASGKQPALLERDNEELPKSLNATSRGERDGALQQGEVPNVMPAPIVNVDGINNDDNFAAFGFRILPPDTDGEVGPNHYVAQVNLLVRVYDKTGAPLTAPFKMSSLFGPLGGICSTNDDGDPIVLYDQLADRWLLSQFGFANFTAPPYHECIAISMTGDPTGSWFLYDFITPGNEFPDYPKLGVWPDGYYMTTNQFTNGGPFNGAGAFAFNRVKMLAGDPTAEMIYFNLDLASHPEAIGGMLPSDLDGLTPPPVGTPNTFSYFLATEFGDAVDALRLFHFTPDYAVPGNSTFIEKAESPLLVTAFDPITPAGRDDIPQPPPSGATSMLDSLGDRLMHRLAYRNMGTHESWVVNHTVDASGDPSAPVYRAGVRYYELHRSGGPISVFEQATFAPADTENRWMGSIAQDNQGNTAVGYSVSSATVFPTINYAGRLVGDPPGGLMQGEATLVAGTGVQTNTQSRWGDYSAMSVDPVDDCTFWYTQEYYTLASQGTSSAGWLTRIGSFKYAGCTAAPQGTLNGTITDCVSGLPIAGATVTATGGYVAITDGSGNYSMTVAPGTYTVTASAPGRPPVSVPGAVVTNGGTTTVNLCLLAAPIIESDGATLVAETCVPNNGAIDPGEEVTVSFCVLNTGGADTVNLVGTLQATGGVTFPSGPQNYGVVVAGGAAVCRDFTFTADPLLDCGDGIVASIDFVDGAFNAGTVTYNFTTGVLTVVFAENFDGVVAPALPAGWTATTAAVPPNADNCPANGGVSLPWATSTTSPDTAPNTAFTNDPQCISDELLDSPSIAIATAGAQLTFRNSFNLEDTFDGGVLEISIGGGAFADIIAAGGSFVSGGYTDTISINFFSPIAGRQAWSGDSGGYITTVANLPAAAAGQNVVLRWRRATDDSVSDQFWRVDTISITDGFVCCVVPDQVPEALEVDGSLPYRPATASPSARATGVSGTFGKNPNPPSGPFGQTPTGVCGPTTITHSASQAITPGSVACISGAGHTNNSYWRAFNLPSFGILGAFSVDCVDIGIEDAISGGGTGQPMTVNLYYVSTGTFPTGTLVSIGTAGPINVTDQSGTILNIPVTGIVPAGAELAVEVFTPDGQAAGNFFFIGSNAAGQTGPSYIQAADCGISTPTDLATIGFPNMHIVMNVRGTAGGVPNGNGVLQPTGEVGMFAPTWGNPSGAEIGLTSTLSNFTGPGPATYTINDATLDYGDIPAGASAICVDCGFVSVTAPARPQVHWDASVDESTAGTPTTTAPAANVQKTWTVHIGDSFTDVLESHIFYQYVETIFHNLITSGCGDGTVYCPDDPTLRNQMAVLSLRGRFGGTYTPPVATGIFADVPADFFQPWIEDFYNLGFTSGCDVGPPLLYCPYLGVTRWQAAMLLLRTRFGGGYTPPAATGIFTDVTPGIFYEPWVEDFYNKGYTNGCNAVPLQYCPDDVLTRGSMAVFIKRVFVLFMYGP